MSDILAIVDQTNTDEQLVEEIALRHPHRVTVLLEDGTVDPQLDDSPRGRALDAIGSRSCSPQSSSAPAPWSWDSREAASSFAAGALTGSSAPHGPIAAPLSTDRRRLGRRRNVLNDESPGHTTGARRLDDVTVALWPRGR